MIQLKNIKKSFLSNNVLLDVNLEIADGQVYGLVGKNGVGKTTLLGIMAGIIDSDSGSCMINSTAAGRDTIAGGHVGYLPDVPNFYENLTVGEYLDFLRMGANSASEGEVLTLADRMHLNLDVPIKKLSRGNRQKLGIVSAVLSKPDILLLDEPMSALDPLGRRDVVDLILSLKEKGMSVVLSSHILSDLESICDRVGFLNAGIIAREVDMKSGEGVVEFYRVTISPEEKVDTTIISQVFKEFEKKFLNNILELVIKRSEDNAAMFAGLAQLPYEIVRVEKNGSHDLESVMEKVINNE